MSASGFSLECGKRLAVIKKDRKIKDKTVYLYDPEFVASSDCTKKKNCKCDHGKCGTIEYHKDCKSQIFNHITAPKNSTFMIAPTNIIHQVSNFFITGAQGTGKSDFVKQYLRVFIKMNKDIPIFLVSEGSEDENLDPLITKRLSPNSIVEEELTFEDFEDVAKQYGGLMIIFDDVDSLPNSKNNGYMKKTTYDLMNSIINNSRKHNINVIFTSHIALAAADTGTMIRSCSNWIFFRAGITKQIENCAIKYFGMSERQMRQLKIFLDKDKSHWISVNKTLPLTITTEHNIFKVDDL